MKKLIISLLLLFPFCVSAACNEALTEEGKEFAKNITTIKSYNEQTSKFTITLDNMVDGMRAIYKKSTYTPKNNKVILENITEGENITVDIYYKDGCSNQIDIIKEKLPYYNNYYKSVICNGYEDILYACNSRFTSYYIDESIVKLAIENYESKRIPIQNDKNITKVEEKDIIEKTKDIIDKWGFRIAILLGTSVISILIGNSLYRKELHGI